MKPLKFIHFFLFLFVSSLLITGTAEASSIKIKCEVRTAAPARSRIWVDGGGLNGWYYAQVKSGTAIVNSPAQRSDSSLEVDFKFDSNPSEVKAGAIYIPASFIKGQTVIGYIRKSGSNLLESAAKATCQLK